MAACPLVCQCFTSIYFEFSQTFSSLLTPCACSLLSHVWLFAMLWTAVHGIFQARILEWVNLFSSRVSSQSRIRTHVSCMAGGFFTHWATWEAQVIHACHSKPLSSQQFVTQHWKLIHIILQLSLRPAVLPSGRYLLLHKCGVSWVKLRLQKLLTS